MNEKKEELFNLMMMLFSELEQGEITEKEMRAWNQSKSNI